MNILTTTATCLFTFVCEGMMYVKFNSITLFAILYSLFQNCIKDIMVNAHPTILECHLLTAGTYLFLVLQVQMSFS